MKKIKKIIEDTNKEQLYKNKIIKQKVKMMKELFSKYNLSFKFDSEIDYFNNYVIYNSIINKENLEKCYEDNRNQMIDIWDTIDFVKKNSFANNAIDKIRSSLKQFNKDEHVIIIPFFDELLNDLYYKEMAIFELPQYYKLQNSFKERMINIDYYYPLPYLCGFSDGHYLMMYQDLIVLYLPCIEKLYLLNKDIVQSIPLMNYEIDLNKFLDLYFGDDPISLINFIIEHKLYSEKVLAKLNKYLTKLSRRKK